MQGNKPFLTWYLEQICAHEKKTGLKLVDLLDVHYYPASEPHFLDTSEKSQTKRIEAVEGLYDDKFIDGSWIQEPVRLIPRLKEYIRDFCPSVQIAVTEYRFGGNSNDPSAAFANAEAMAIMGREGVRLATLWSEVNKNSILEDAFNLFLNYDGKGSNALDGKSIPIQIENEIENEIDFKARKPSEKVTAYAIETEKSRLVYVFNRSPRSVQANLRFDTKKSIDGKTKKEAALRRFELTPEKGLHQVTKNEGESGNEPTRMTIPARSVSLSEWKKK
jgi:hypothetical protein